MAARAAFSMLVVTSSWPLRNAVPSAGVVRIRLLDVDVIWQELAPVTTGRRHVRTETIASITRGEEWAIVNND